MYKKKSILWFEKAWRNILYLVSRKGKHKVNLLKTGVHSKYQIFKIKDYSTQTFAMVRESRILQPSSTVCA